MQRAPCRMPGPYLTGTKRPWAEAEALELLELGSKKPWDVERNQPRLEGDSVHTNSSDATSGGRGPVWQPVETA